MEIDYVKKPRFIMVQGTMSNAGKSLVVAGLCRVFAQDGFKVAPFKSQNMALNSFVTKEGLEMGRAQVMQAEAAGAEPEVSMNPILLKPTSDVGSQVIVNGTAVGNMKARDYFEYKKELVPVIENAVKKLSDKYEIIVIEGAGSPAEINLKDNDIVNMGMAKLVDAPVLLVGDIDRGGVFAQLIGTLELIEDDERQRVKGLVINKFRGDKSILDPGISMLEKKGGVKVVGVLPYIDIKLDDEDSLTERFDSKDTSLIDIAVIRLPHISNFTDFGVFDRFYEVSIRFVTRACELGSPDLIIIPGTKNTIADLKWMRERGLDLAIKRYAAEDGPVIGICGGFQILGEKISDEYKSESGGSLQGLSLLPVATSLKMEKTLLETSGIIEDSTGLFAGLKGKSYSGYEIHMGETFLTGGDAKPFTDKATGYCQGNVYGSYIHGIFDEEEICTEVVRTIAAKKGITLGRAVADDYRAFKESQYDALAGMIRKYMDMDEIYRIMGIDRK